MRGEVEVAVIGGGLAGAALAAVLARRGRDVVLCDLHETYPFDFRAEKLTGRQMALLDTLGLGARVRAVATPIPHLSIARFGTLVERRPNDEYGLDYAVLVNAIRAAVPAPARMTRRVAGVVATGDRQTISFGDGTSVSARLVVLATGLGRGLLDGLGIRRVPVQKDHCLAVGFDLATDGRAPASLTYYGDRRADRSAYLTLFPIGDRQRANLFVYRRYDEGWARAFCAAPETMLAAMMPGLAPLHGEVRVLGQPVVRPIELYASEHHLRDGVVLVGDAFATTCPTGGTGIEKVLTDVDRLAALVPGWLAGPGMARDKIARFYADPAKLACDAHARRMIDYARAMAVDPGLVWTVRRYRNYYAQMLRHWARRRFRPTVA